MAHTLKTFESVRDYLSSISYIDQGGCGIAALAMYRWLKMNEGVKVKFVYLDSREYNHNQNKQYIEKKDGCPNACNHIAISYNKEFIDCSSVVDISMYTFRIVTANESALIDTINNIGSWNESFDREKYIPLIEKKLGVKLSDVFIGY